METVTLTKVFRKKVETKYGEKMSVGILTKEHGDTWINGFKHDDNKGWKIGDTVNIEIVKNGEYTNFKNPNTKLTEKRVKEIIKEEVDARMKKLMTYLKENYQAK